MHRRFGDKFDLRKNVVYAIGFNLVQIAAILTIFLIVLLTDAEYISAAYMEGFVLVAGFLCCMGAVADIIQALMARQVDEQRFMLVDANEKLENLNRTLRVQRHDFMNHLQVVNGLIEMGEHEEAGRYIEKVYGEIQQVSKTLKTASPAINALLQVKMGEAEKRGILMEVEIRSAWENAPLPGWEMCRVLGNLIDNAMDALQKTQKPRVKITLGEDLKNFWFQVENNGPSIREKALQRIFEPGVSSKGTGRGMGLFIVKELMKEGGGGIRCISDSEKTVFEGVLPRKPREEKIQEKAP